MFNLEEFFKEYIDQFVHDAMYHDKKQIIRTITYRINNKDKYQQRETVKHLFSKEVVGSGEVTGRLVGSSGVDVIGTFTSTLELSTENESDLIQTITMEMTHWSPFYMREFKENESPVALDFIYDAEVGDYTVVMNNRIPFTKSDALPVASMERLNTQEGNTNTTTVRLGIIRMSQSEFGVILDLNAYGDIHIAEAKKLMGIAKQKANLDISLVDSTYEPLGKAHILELKDIATKGDKGDDVYIINGTIECTLEAGKSLLDEPTDDEKEIWFALTYDENEEVVLQYQAPLDALFKSE